MPQNSPSPSPNLEPLLQAFPLRTWSMIVTIMGDLLASPTDRISGRALAHLTGRMGISEQALRVAIHRLKKDGWIEAQREGRGSSYYLTPGARQRTEEARPRIYGSAPPNPGPAHLMILPPDSVPDASAPGVTLMPRCVLVAGAPADAQDHLCLPLGAAPLPDWLQDQIIAPELCSERDALEQLSTDLSACLPALQPDRWAARLVLLHHWRRIVLRLPELAESLAPENGPSARSRAAIHAMLRQLPAPSLQQLTESLA